MASGKPVVGLDFDSKDVKAAPSESGSAAPAVPSFGELIPRKFARPVIVNAAQYIADRKLTTEQALAAEPNTVSKNPEDYIIMMVNGSTKAVLIAKEYAMDKNEEVYANEEKDEEEKADDSADGKTAPDDGKDVKDAKADEAGAVKKKKVHSTGVVRITLTDPKEKDTSVFVALKSMGSPENPVMRNGDRILMYIARALYMLNGRVRPILVRPAFKFSLRENLGFEDMQDLFDEITKKQPYDITKFLYAANYFAYLSLVGLGAYQIAVKVKEKGAAISKDDLPEYRVPAENFHGSPEDDGKSAADIKADPNYYQS